MSANVQNRTFATFDSTPNVFDNRVFIEMMAGNRVLISDGSFASDPNTVAVMNEFASGTNQYFLDAFGVAFTKMTLLGVNSTLISLDWS